MGIGEIASWSQAHWIKMGIQAQEKCRRGGSETQGQIGCQGVCVEAKHRF
jgi:hypothetical protein